MALNKTYSPEFERLYRTWPNYPKGRTKKHLAAKAFAKVKKDFDLTQSDIEEMILLVERMKKDRKSWQKGNTYGPQGLQVWLNQAGWQDEYDTIKPAQRQVNYVEQTETPDQIAAKMQEQQARFEEATRQAELRREMQKKGLA